jgi:hypothetical protein
MRDVANWLIRRKKGSGVFLVEICKKTPDPFFRDGLHRGLLAVPVVASLLANACGATPPKPVQKEVVIWKNLGQWSGRGNVQTESFIGLTGALRMHWRTKNEVPKGAGTFRLMLHSAISGRVLQEPVDETGPGVGTAYAADDPRAFYISVESANLDWSVTVEEALFGRQAEDPNKPH